MNTPTRPMITHLRADLLRALELLTLAWAHELAATKDGYYQNLGHAADSLTDAVAYLDAWLKRPQS